MNLLDLERNLPKIKRNNGLKRMFIFNNFSEGTNFRIGSNNSVIFKIKPQKVQDLFAQF